MPGGNVLKGVDQFTVTREFDLVEVVCQRLAIPPDGGCREADGHLHHFLGLTALEKLCGKKKLMELIGDYIQKSAGKPTLAPVSDKRKAFSRKKLEEMFKEDN